MSLRHRLMQWMENSKSVTVSDDYLTRLRQVNTGMLLAGNLHCFEYCVQHLPNDAPILEIGAFCGLSTNAITYFKTKHGVSNKLITCDRWDYNFKGLDDTRLGSSDITGSEWGRFARETFVHNVRFFSRADLPFAVEMFSDELFSAWEGAETRTDMFGRDIQLGGEISFCFIDGNHDYEYVSRDFEHADRYLAQQGFILFDDSSRYGGSPGVQKLMRELTSRKVIGQRYRLVMRNPNYLIQLR